MAQSQVQDRGAAGKPAASSPQPPTESASRRQAPWFVELYRSSVGKKYAMAISGIVLLGYVLAHMVGNLKLYLGPEEMNHYGEWLREFGTPALPRTVLLWIMRSVLIAAFVIHIHAAYALTVINRRARPVPYQSRRDWIVADFAARTMRWTGVIVALFVIYHLMDLTWGVEAVSPDFVRGAPYQNLVNSFSNLWVALFYILANIALGVHIFHGAWSLFQSLGWNKQRFNQWRRWFAIGFAAVIVLGNISFPIAVQTGLVDQAPLASTASGSTD